VELALLLPMLVMLLLGSVTGGLAYSDHLAITNAAREGGRLGAGLDYLASPPTWGTTVQDRVKQVYFNAGSTIATSEVCVQLVDASGNVLASPATQGTACGTAPATPATVATGQCVVKVWIKKPASITLAVLPSLNFDISAASVSAYGRTGGTVCTAT
jgi:Flp pilus assembly protein TadG